MFRTQRNFIILNKLFQNKIKFSDTQTKTQQNFKVLVTNPDAESDRNLGLALVNVTAKSPFLCRLSGGLSEMASSSSISDNTEEESIISYYFSRGYMYEVITEFVFSIRLLCCRKDCCVSEEKLSCVLPLWATVHFLPCWE